MLSFFKRSQSAQETAPSTKRSTPSSTPDTDRLRRRARQRLMGSVILVLAALVVFPWLFDSQPRSVNMDLSFDIPDKTSSAAAPPLQPASTVTPTTPTIASTATPAAASASPPNAVSTAPLLSSVSQTAANEPATHQPQTTASSNHTTKEETTASKSSSDAARAQALLEGKTAATANATKRWIIQVGAFEQAQKVHEVRTKLEKLGITTYTQVVKTKTGQRTRIRIGPLDSETEAKHMQERIKQAGFSPAILKI